MLARLALVALLLVVAVPAVSASDDASLIRLYTKDRALVQKLLDAGVDSPGEGAGFIDLIVPADRLKLKTLLASERTEVILPDVHAPFEAFRGKENLGIYHTVAEIDETIDAVAAAHPELVKVETIGHSIQGRAIRALQLRGPNAPADAPAFLFFGAVHAREWIANEVIIALLEHLVGNYGSDAAVTRLLDSREIWIVPVGNPDGVHYSQTEYKMWRKNRRDNGDGTFGVDLNRNWGFAWGGPGSSSTSGSDTYHGTAAFSEPETAALRDLALRERFVASIACHSYSQLVLWPFGCTEDDPVDLPFFAVHGQEMARMMGGYTPEQASDLYVCSGVSDDWLYGELGMLSYTFEFGKQFIPEEGDVPAICERFVRCGLYLLENAADPFPLIVHAPLATTTDTEGPYAVEARFNRRHHADDPVTAMDLLVETAEGTSRVAMADQGDDLWTGSIAGTGYGTRRYRIEVRTAAGETAVFPGEGDWYGFDVVETLILLVDDDRGKGFESYYLDALKTLGLPVLCWDRKKGCPSVASLVDATAVIWFTGTDSSTTLEAEDQKNLREALSRGARLLLFGEDIGYDLKNDAFYGEVLRAAYHLDKSGSEALRGLPESFLAGDAFSLAKGQDNEYQSFPEVFRPLDGATALLEYVGDEVMVGAQAVETERERFAYFGFGLEGIGTAAARERLLATSLEWLSRPCPSDLARATSLGRQAAAGRTASRRALDAFWAALPARLQANAFELGAPPAGVNRVVYERVRSALRRAELLRR